LATALTELASATGLGVDIDHASIPVYPECAALCAALGLDPLGLIASGALLAVVPPDSADAAVAAVEHGGVACAVIGTLTSERSGAWLTRAGLREPMPVFAVDEIAGYFANSLAKRKPVCYTPRQTSAAMPEHGQGGGRVLTLVSARRRG
jgi:hydrogenase maturation factor